MKNTWSEHQTHCAIAHAYTDSVLSLSVCFNLSLLTLSRRFHSLHSRTFLAALHTHSCCFNTLFSVVVLCAFYFFFFSLSSLPFCCCLSSFGWILSIAHFYLCFAYRFRSRCMSFPTFLFMVASHVLLGVRNTLTRLAVQLELRLLYMYLHQFSWFRNTELTRRIFL